MGILATGEDVLPIGRPGHRVYGPFVPEVRVHVRTAGQVHHLDRPIRAARDSVRARGGKGNAPYPGHIAVDRQGGVPPLYPQGWLVR